MQERKIGLYGGTFDPIHFGHLNLAIQLMEGRGLDEVWFCPARCSPHKLDVESTSSSHRLNMLYLATAPLPQFRVIDDELQRPGPSYTIDTVESIQKKLALEEPKATLYLLMGDDSIRGLHRWHKVDLLLQTVSLLIGCRERVGVPEIPEGSVALRQAIATALHPTSFLDISATELRRRLAEHRYCGHLLPREVLDYISKHNLYCPPVYQ